MQNFLEAVQARSWRSNLLVCAVKSENCTAAFGIPVFQTWRGKNENVKKIGLKKSGIGEIKMELKIAVFSWAGKQN